MVYTGDNMKLLHQNVAIEQDEPEDKTESGIYLAEQIKTYSPYGTVEAVGSNISGLKQGDRVIYQPHGGQVVTYKGKELDIVPYTSVLAKIS